MTAGAPYILAGSFAEAHTFAQEELKAERGYYRVATSPASIKGPQGADLYVVPGWQRRRDRFPMQTAMRFTRLNVIDVAEWRAAREEAHSEPDGLEPEGAQLSLVDPEGLAKEGPAGATAGGEPTEAETEESKRRRRRCKECGVLVDPDEVEAHAAEHLPEGV